MPEFERKSFIAAKPEEVYRWHASEGAFQRLAPPWQEMKIIERNHSLDTGSRTVLETRSGLAKFRWVAEHVDNQPGRSFTDRQVEGPFAAWEHRHLFEEADRGCMLVDRIQYKLPAGSVGRWLGQSVVKKDLQRLFDYRHEVTKRDIETWLAARDRPRRSVAITGGSGFLGSNLRALLLGRQHRVQVLTRSPDGKDDVHWDPANQEIDLEALKEVDVIVNLAGANLTDEGWSDKRKALLWSSRVDSTRFLVDSLAKLDAPPRRFLSGSGVGYYGATEDKLVDEKLDSGDGFLSKLCVAWEGEARKAEASLGSQVALLRTGVVLDPRGGAMKKMLPIFKMGVAGPLAGGGAWMPWIALDDWIGAVARMVEDDSMAGPYNLTSPEPEKNERFTKLLGDALSRPTFLPVPKVGLKALYGEMADETILQSSRAMPRRLEEAGHAFRYPKLRDALAFMLGQAGPARKAD